MSKAECDICGRWPKVASEEYGDDYCAFHARVMRWWSDSYGTEWYEMQGQRVRAFLSGVRDRLRVMWIVETLYALRYGGPFDFAPWSSIARWTCRTFGHRWPLAIAVSREPDQKGRKWFLFRCERCNGETSMPEGNCGTARFAREVSYRTIWCGFRALSEGEIRPVCLEARDDR